MGRWFYFLKNKAVKWTSLHIGLVLVLGFVILALLAPLLAPYRYDQVFPEHLRLPPVFSSGGHADFILGTDDLGRDILSRLLWGAQLSLGIGACSIFLATFLGCFLGALAATTRPWVDQVLSRFMDIILALPSMLMAIVVIAILGPSLLNTVLAVGLVLVPSIFRVVRVSLIQETQETYYLALQTLGASWWRKTMINAFPNTMPPLTVQVSLGFSEAILNAAALGFLGLGAQPPWPEWGVMLSDARPFIESAPWQVTLPGLCILLLVLGLNLLGDGLRDVLDPKLKR